MSLAEAEEGQGYVKQYYYKAPGAALCPNYKDVKYYGYLPDGNGGIKANVEYYGQ